MEERGTGPHGVPSCKHRGHCLEASLSTVRKVILENHLAISQIVFTVFTKVS
jgi:hypothetical protein